MAKRTIVCFGDSVTQGLPSVPVEDTFPALLERRLNFNIGDDEEPITVINAGVGGHTSAEGLARFEDDVVAHQPFLVPVEFGLNDIRPEPGKLLQLDEFEGKLHEIYHRCTQLGAKVIFMTPNPIIDKMHGSWGTELYRDFGGCNGKVAAYAEVVRKVASGTGAPLCDINLAFIKMAIEKQFAGECYDYTDLTCIADLISSVDGVHPTIQGQSMIASELYASILLHGLL